MRLCYDFRAIVLRKLGGSENGKSGLPCKELFGDRVSRVILRAKSRSTEMYVEDERE